jgi:hypothetical protein
MAAEWTEGLGKFETKFREGYTGKLPKGQMYFAGKSCCFVKTKRSQYTSNPDGIHEITHIQVKPDRELHFLKTYGLDSYYIEVKL